MHQVKSDTASGGAWHGLLGEPLSRMPGIRSHANNFNVVRLVLASAVIWTHSHVFMSGIKEMDQIRPWLGVPVSYIAVNGFFFLSGFLVYASLERRGSVPSFLFARFARLWPALAVITLLTVAGGWYFTSAQGSDYFRGETARFLIRNLTMVKMSYWLTGIDCGGTKCAVNESLWTIAWEVRAYLLLAALGTLGLARTSAMKWLVLPGTATFALLWHVDAVHSLLSRNVPPGIMWNFMEIDRLWTMFALGIAAWVWRDHLRLSWLVALALLAATLLTAHSGAGFHIRSVTIAYWVLCCGLLTARNGAFSAGWSDYSYGTYLYAFPIMLLLAGAFHFDAAWQLALANLAATLPIAALSWHLVEHPALKLARSLR